MVKRVVATSALVLLSSWSLTAVYREVPEVTPRRAVDPLTVLGAVPAAPAIGVRASAVAQDPAVGEAALGLDRPARRLIQQGLRQEGFDPGAPDGLFGPRTRAAIRAWQASRGALATGYLTGSEAELLRTATTSGTPTSVNGGAAAPTPDVSRPTEDPAERSEVGPLGATATSGAASAERDETAASEQPIAPEALTPGADAVEGPASAAAPDSASLVVEATSPPIPADVVPDEVDDASEREADSAEESPAARAAGPVQLPPEIRIDRHLIRVERLLAADNHAGAHAVMQEIVALQEENAVTLPDDFAFRYAQVALGAGLTETAIGSLKEYLLMAGREGVFYREALELLDSAEETLRREEADRRRADAERRLQQEVDAFVRRQREAAARPVPRDSLQSGGLGPELVGLPTGRFQYYANSFEGARWVSIESPFAISKYEVTRGEFSRFAERSGYRTEAERSEDDDVCRGRRWTWRHLFFTQTDAHPVVCVTIRDAMAYAEWLSQETGHTYRLPSSAEWQYAARAGTEEAMLYVERDLGNRASYNCGRGNYRETGRQSPCPDGIENTAPVGRFPPNGIGLHDMIGNVEEWILACPHPIPDNDDYIAPRSDGAPEDPRNCRFHWAVGASFRHPVYNGYATRMVNDTFATSSDVGFRVLRELAEEHPAPR